MLEMLSTGVGPTNCRRSGQAGKPAQLSESLWNHSLALAATCKPPPIVESRGTSGNAQTGRKQSRNK